MFKLITYINDEPIVSYHHSYDSAKFLFNRRIEKWPGKNRIYKTDGKFGSKVEEWTLVESDEVE